MLVAGVAQVVGVGARGGGVVPNHQSNEGSAAQRILIGRGNVVGRLIAQRQGVVAQYAVQPREIEDVRVELLGLIDLKDEARRREDVGRQVRRVGVEHHQFGEGVVLHLGEEVQPRQAGQVVEAVAVLQRFQLRLEDEVEGRAEQTTKGHLFLGQAADPEVDGVNAGDGHAIRHVGINAGAVQESEAVGRHDSVTILVDPEDEFHGRRALARQRRRAGDADVRAIGRDEVDD